MQHIYAPWREEYFTQKVDGCAFCHASKNSSQDEQSRVLYRDNICFVIMNKYPYTPAHIMVIPHKHISTLEELKDSEFAHISTIVKYGVKMLKDVFNAKGVNIGMNLGEAAGAGIAEHIHYHIVPRWGRDTNFITTIAGARVFGNDEEKLYKRLKQNWMNYVTIQ